MEVADAQCASAASGAEGASTRDRGPTSDGRDRERSPVPGRAVAAGKQSVPLYAVGSNVIIHGLSAMEYNERVGRITDFNEVKSRYAVLVAGRSEPILLKEENLRPSIFGPT